MKTLREIEEFLERETRGDYKTTWSKDEKMRWLVGNAMEAKRIVFKMRGVGRKAWGNFLWSFDLEETVILSLTNKDGFAIHPSCPVRFSGGSPTLVSRDVVVERVLEVANDIDAYLQSNVPLEHYRKDIGTKFTELIEFFRPTRIDPP